MKRHLLLGLLLCGSILSTNAENTDSLRINKLETALQSETRARERLSSELNAQKSIISEQKKIIDSLRANINVNAQNIKTTADQLGVKIEDTNTILETKANTTDLKSKSTVGAILLGLLLLISAVVYVLLNKRIVKGDANIEALRAKADKLNEEVLNQFSLEMAEMKKISDALAKAPTSSTTSSSEDHSLIKTLADRITFMEMTLFKMDPKVRGYKQLTKSISQMKDNLLANGYELVDMLGKPYNDGMKVTANFIEDEDLEAGKQIITGIIKPQINYKGTMIQAAQITVSQNI
ncbi:MAG: hypothetical protein MJY71_02145 [Bacteroidaceae bacterium]|nr:hypothetical protein [Bacteroidaceae bacterium]